MTNNSDPQRNPDVRLHHRLNAPCPECGDPMWLHTDRCLKIRPAVESSRTEFDACVCTRTAGDFAA